jgi:hypothetical protein
MSLCTTAPSTLILDLEAGRGNRIVVTAHSLVGACPQIRLLASHSTSQSMSPNDAISTRYEQMTIEWER